MQIDIDMFTTLAISPGPPSTAWKELRSQSEAQRTLNLNGACAQHVTTPKKTWVFVYPDAESLRALVKSLGRFDENCKQMKLEFLYAKVNPERKCNLV